MCRMFCAAKARMGRHGREVAALARKGVRGQPAGMEVGSALETERKGTWGSTCKKSVTWMPFQCTFRGGGDVGAGAVGSLAALLLEASMILTPLLVSQRY